MKFDLLIKNGTVLDGTGAVRRFDKSAPLHYIVVHKRSKL
jgi:hypothetical protein